MLRFVILATVLVAGLSGCGSSNEVKCGTGTCAGCCTCGSATKAPA